MRMSVVFVALAVVGTLVYLLSGGGDEDTRGPELDRQEHDEDALPRLRGTDRLRPTSPLPSETAGRADPEPTSVDSTATYAVVGQVKGLEPGEHMRTTVYVRALREFDWLESSVEPARGVLAADGSFRVELGLWLERNDDTQRVEVSADHPDYVVARAKTDLRPRPAVVTPLEDPLAMQRANVIQGVVRGADGGPVEKARVALFGMKGDELALDADYDALRLDHVTTDADGAFRLRTEKTGAVLLAASASEHPPAGHRLTLDAGSGPRRVDVSLDPGHAIHGIVRLNGQPLVGASVRARIAGTGRSTDLNGVGGVWVAGEIHASGGVFGTGEDGSFSLRGLDDATRTLSVLGVDHHLVLRGVTRSAAIDVKPPAQGVVVEISAAVVRVEVRSGAELISGAQVGVRPVDRSGASFKPSPEGTVDILLPADTPVLVQAEHARYGEVEQELPGYAAGSTTTVTLDLGPPKARASARIVLKDAAGVPVRQAGFRVLDPHEGSPIQGFDGGLGLRKSDDGVYVLEDLEAGERTLVVTPDRPPEAFRGRYLRIVRPVVLAAGRETALELEARKGARVILRVRGADGELIDSSVNVEDGRGTKLSVAWYWSDDNSASVSSGGPGAASATMEPPLEPGAYRFEIGAVGHRMRVIEFTVREDETQELEVTLEKM